MDNGSAAMMVLFLVVGAAAVVASTRIREKWYVWLPLAVVGAAVLGTGVANLITYLTVIEDTLMILRIWPW